MEPNDQQLKEQLANGPLARNGFDARLRQRIENRIEEEGRRIRRPWKSLWRLPAAAFASLAVVLLGIWVIRGHGGTETSSDSLALSSTTASTAMNAASAAEQKKYALLIGLRKDEAGKEGGMTAAYRTVLVAQEAGRLGKFADNKGLFLPHKQDFWQIQTEEPGDGRQSIRAVQVTNRKAGRLDARVTVPDNRLSERVLFAGNTYLSVQTTVRDGTNNAAEIRHVKSLDQINQKSADPANDPHIRLEELFAGGSSSSAASDQWSIVRNPGQWVPISYDADSVDGRRLPVMLPAEVVNRDTLSMRWEQIQKIEPAARDAFMYGNLLGVVVGGQIRVYELEPGREAHQVFTFPLAPGEVVVMIQWAEGHYVDKWIRDMQSLSRK